MHLEGWVFDSDFAGFASPAFLFLSPFMLWCRAEIDWDKQVGDYPTILHPGVGGGGDFTTTGMALTTE